MNILSLKTFWLYFNECLLDSKQKRSGLSQITGYILLPLSNCKKNVFKTRSWSMRLSKYVYAGFIKLTKISYTKLGYFLHYILELFITYFQTLSDCQNLIFELTILDVRGFGFPKWRTQNYFFRTIVDVCTTIHSRLKHG